MITRFATFALFLALVAMAAATGVFATPGVWYNKELVLPSWTPPNHVFGPVWTILYVLVAVSGYRVWAASGWQRKAHTLYFAQLVLNAAWTIVFFGLHAPGVALGVIVLLALAILATIVLFSRHDPLATLLLVPYLLWVLYATSLNAGIVALN